MSELFLLNIALINERRGKNYPGEFMNQEHYTKLCLDWKAMVVIKSQQGVSIDF